MVEVAGLSLGILTALNSSIGCFDAISVARTFDRDFQTATLKLDVARLRLSRWARSVGIDSLENDDGAPQARPLIASGSLEEQSKATEILEQITALFKDAERKSSRLKLVDSSAYDTDELDPATSSMHRKLRKLYLASYSPRRILTKTKWSLYHDKDLRRLIEDINDHVSGLVEIFPAASQKYNQQCLEQSRELSGEQHLAALEPIVAEQDPDLCKAIAGVKAEAQGDSQTTFNFGSTNYGMQLAYLSGTQTNHFGFGRARD